jgi:hypothetical protein
LAAVPEPHPTIAMAKPQTTVMCTALRLDESDIDHKDAGQAQTAHHPNGMTCALDRSAIEVIPFG